MRSKRAAGLISSLPDTLQLGHLQYKLEFIQELRDNLDGSRMMGQFLNMGRTIQVDADMDGPQTADTIFHEITHAFFEVHGIPRKRLDEEQVAMAMGCAWTQFAQNNPGVLTILESLACA